MASAIAMALILTALGVFLYARLSSEFMRAVDLGLKSRADSIAAGMGQQGQSFADTPDSGEVTIAQILTPKGTVTETSGTSVSLLSAAEIGSMRSATYLERSAPGLSAPLRLYVLPTNEGQPLFIVVASPLDQQRHVLRSFLLLLVVGGSAALGLASVASWFFTGASLRPIDRMRAEAAAISVSEPGRRLPVPGTNDEVARLGSTLNSMLDRLQDALGAERRLLDDASHELRTPLAILKAELDLALSRARTPQELEAALRSASQETDRVARLAEDLLVLSRAQRGRLEIRRQEISLHELLDRACAAQRTRTESDGIAIDLVTPEALVCVDPVRLRQALDNLLDNAVRYSPPGGVIRVEADIQDGELHIAVQDVGAGFADPEADNVFDPFVRDETGAIRRHEGAGLGLAIVRAVAEAHGGQARAGNRAEGGAVVSMTLLDLPSES